MSKGKVAFSVVAVLVGVFLFVYGGYDDSPGAQLIGIIIVIGASVDMGRSRKKGAKRE